jgi:arylsulfatase A-like enzyme
VAARITDEGGICWQFHHVIDIVPTILEATGIPAPVMVDGIAQKPIEGVSMASTFEKANANAPSTHRTQYFEMMGVQGLYSGGWMLSAVPVRPPGSYSARPFKTRRALSRSSCTTCATTGRSTPTLLLLIRPRCGK